MWCVCAAHRADRMAPVGQAGGRRALEESTDGLCPGFYWCFWKVIGCYRVLSGVIVCYRVLSGVIGCYRVFIRKPWPQSIGAPCGALLSPRRRGYLKKKTNNHVFKYPRRRGEGGLSKRAPTDCVQGITGVFGK